MKALRDHADAGVQHPHEVPYLSECIFNSSALALLRRLEDVRTAEGIPIRQAVARVSEELDGNGARPVRKSEESELVEELRSRVTWPESENVQLWGLLDSITPRLSGGPGRRWLP